MLVENGYSYRYNSSQVIAPVFKSTVKAHSSVIQNPESIHYSKGNVHNYTNNKFNIIILCIIFKVIIHHTIPKKSI